jgi:hypothetical protein
MPQTKITPSYGTTAAELKCPPADVASTPGSQSTCHSVKVRKSNTGGYGTDEIPSVFYAMDDATIRLRMATAYAYIRDRERYFQELKDAKEKEAAELVAEGRAVEAAAFMAVPKVSVTVERPCVS